MKSTIKKQAGFALLELLIFAAVLPSALLVASRASDVVAKTSQFFKSNNTKNSINVIKAYLVTRAANPEADGVFGLPKDASGGSGGDLPGTLPLNPADEWGSSYRYCNWDTGAANTFNPALSQNTVGVPAGGIIGQVISAGKDKVFQTACGGSVALGDDIQVNIYNSDVLSSNGNIGGWADSDSNVTLLNPADNVGLGVATPTHKLELAAGLTPSAGVALGDVELYRSAANTLALATGDSLDLLSGSIRVGGTTVVDSSRNITGQGITGSNLTLSGGSLTMTNATSNTILLPAAGVASPSTASQSVGTKMVLYPRPAGGADYAIGISTASIWQSVPFNTSTYAFKWHGGATNIMTLDGTGHLGVGTAPDAAYFVNSAGAINASSYYLNGVLTAPPVPGLSAGQTLYWDGTQWTPTTGLSYMAGTGAVNVASGAFQMGAVDVINSARNLVGVNAAAQNLIPAANNTYNLGSPTSQWANIYGNAVYQNGNKVADVFGSSIGYIPKFSGLNTLGNSLIYDSGTNVGIGTATPLSSLHTTGTLTIGAGATAQTPGNMQLTTGGASPIKNRLIFGTDGTGWKFAIAKNQGGTVTDLLTVEDDGDIVLGKIASGTWNGTAVTPGYGGTGISSYVIGDMLYASGATTLSRLAGVAAGNVLISGGVGAAPAWGKVGLTSHVSGILSVANGGTGVDGSAAANGQLLIGNGTGFSLGNVTGSNGTFVTNTAGGINIGLGLGATSTTGTLDWNDVSNTKPGSTPTLLMGNAANGAGAAAYFHPMNFEYSATKGGTGNVTQLAIPYTTASAINSGIWLRGRYNAAWTGWKNILYSDFSNVSGSLPIANLAAGDYSSKITSGTYGINITGNAATATTASSSPLLSAVPYYTWTGATLPAAYPLGVQSSFVRAADGFPQYGSVVTVNTFSNGGGALQLYTPYSPVYGGNALQVRFGDHDLADTWTAWKTILASDNFNTYAPTLTGTGASGTWSISVTGNAGTVTNGVYTTGSYADPAWITSLSKAKVGLGSVENTALSTWAGSSNITTLGTISAGIWNGTAISAAKGGTGITSYAIGDLIYASGATTLSKLADVVTGNVLISGGVGVAPAWGKIDLGTHVSGTLPIARLAAGDYSSKITSGSYSVDITGNAGTVTNGVYTTGSYVDPAWITSLSKAKVGLSNVEDTALSTWAGTSNITTLGTISTGTWNGTTISAAKGGTGITSYAIGDLIYASGATTLSKLADVATGNVLVSGGVGVAPSWGKIGLATHVSGTLTAANGGTGINGSAAANGQLLIGNGAGYSLATLTGTANQVIVTNSAGGITLSLPQSIATTSTPTFGGATINGSLALNGIPTVTAANPNLTFNDSTPGAANQSKARLFYYDDGFLFRALNDDFTIRQELLSINQNGQVIAYPFGVAKMMLYNDLSNLVGNPVINGNLKVNGHLTVEEHNSSISFNDSTPFAANQSKAELFYYDQGFLFRALNDDLTIRQELLSINQSGQVVAYPFGVAKMLMYNDFSNTSIVLGIDKGGTGIQSAPTNGQLLIGNGTGYSLATLTGTANQVNVTNSAGGITLSLPQSIATTSIPTFGGANINGILTLSGDNATPLVIRRTNVANANIRYENNEGFKYAGLNNQEAFAVGSNQDLSVNPDFVVTQTALVGVGLAVPLSKLSVLGNASIGTWAGTNAAPANGLLVSGSVLIGTTTDSGYKLRVNGTGYFDGALTASAGAWSSSDIRLKRDIVSLSSTGNIVDKIRKLNGVYYYWRQAQYPDRNFDGRRQIGVVAQQVEAVFPELVNTGPDGFKTVAYDKLTAVLIEGAKAQQSQLDDHEQRIKKNGDDIAAIREKEITKLSTENSLLKAKLAALENFVSGWFQSSQGSPASR